MTSHLNHVLSLQRDLERTLFLTGSPTMRLMEDVRRANERYTRLLNAGLPISDVLKTLGPLQLAKIQQEMQALTRPALVDDLQRLLPNRSLWQRIHQHQDLFDQFRLHTDAVSQVYRDFAWAQKLVTQPGLFASIHINQTADRITRWEAAGRSAEPLAVSIACTESQAIAQQDEILNYQAAFDFEQVDVDEGQEDDAFLPTHNLYHCQRTELVVVARTNPDFLDDDSVLDELGTNRYFTRAQAVCGLVTEINRLCKMSSRDPIFKLTDQLVQSLIALPTIYAIRRGHFCEFIDHIYFIVYEGAGKDSLRFLDLIDKDTEAEPVWTLKHLRNFYARHDVEHGKERDVRKKQERLAQILVELIEKPLPATRDDFTRAQRVFLQRIEAMLRLIYDRLTQVSAGETANQNERGETPA